MEVPSGLVLELAGVVVVVVGAAQVVLQASAGHWEMLVLGALVAEVGWAGAPLQVGAWAGD